MIVTCEKCGKKRNTDTAPECLWCVEKKEEEGAYNKVCIYCGKIFYTNIPNKSYDSPYCKGKQYKSKVKE